MPVLQNFSLANPIGGSAAFDHGTKGSYSYITVSVGDISAAPAGYLNSPSSGQPVTATITSSILEFSYPQSHIYVGVGDVVTFSDTTQCYLNRKLSTTKWEVLQSVGGQFIFGPDTIGPKTVTSINKVYASLTTAMANVQTLTGWTDLTAARSILRVACYQPNLNDLITAPVVTPVWVSSQEYYAKIYAPHDIANDCNTSQRHSGHSSSGYRLFNNLSTINGMLTVTSNYTQVDGLIVDGAGDPASSGIKISGASIVGVKITKNVIINMGIGVENDNVAAGNNVVANNLFTGMSNIGISLTNKFATIYSNTLIGDGVGLYGIQANNTDGAAMINVTNNLVQGSITKDIDVHTPSTMIKNCITSDNSCSASSSSYPNKTIFFKDPFNDTSILDSKADDEAVIHGMFLENDPTYQVTTDIVGNTRGVSTIANDEYNSIGCFYYAREFFVAVGNPIQNLMTGTPNATISNGRMSFDVYQGNSFLCTGCVVTLSTSDQYILGHVESDSSWDVIKYDTANQGKRAADLASTSVTSIQVQYADLSNAITDNGGGNSGIATSFSGGIAASTVRSTVIYCTYGQSTNDSPINTDLSYVKNSITITTPNNILAGPDSFYDCNTSRRHMGVYDDSSPRNIFFLEGTIELTRPNVTVSYMQISNSYWGIQVTDKYADGSKGYHDILGNIITLITYNGIDLHSITPGGKIAVVNNLIYECTGSGIKIHDDYQHAQPATFLVYNNTTIGNNIGVDVESQDLDMFRNIVKIKNHLEQKSLTIGYRSTSYVPSVVTCESSLDSGTSVSNLFGKYNKVNSIVRFANPTYDDFHIILSTFARFVDAQQLYADPDYSFSDDIDSASRFDIAIGYNDGTNKWDIGCDNYTFSELNLSHFSVGSYSLNGGDLKPADPIYVYAYFGVARFYSDPEGTIPVSLPSNVGIGDHIITGSTDFYLSEKGNSFTWGVVFSGGSITGNNALEAVARIERTATSLSAAFEPTGGILATILGSQDLYSLAISKLNVWCYNDGSIDTTPLTVSGWNTTDSYKISIQTPWDTVTQCNSTQRHSGKADVVGYQVATTGSDAVTIDNQFTDFNGFIVTSPSSDGVVLGVNAGTNNVISNVVHDCVNGIIEKSSANGDPKILANIIYNASTGIKALANSAIYNNTVVNPTIYGIDAAVSTFTPYNNLVYYDTAAPTGCYAPALYSNVFYCLAKDASIQAGGGNIINAVVNFVDDTNKDYHLKRNDWIALGAGVDESLAFDENTPFNYDVDMQILGSNDWSIGADSVPSMATIPLYFSVGIDSSNLMNGGSGNTINIVGGIATFSRPQDKDSIGIGMSVIYGNDNKQCFLYKKHSYTQWGVRDKFGLIPEDASNLSVTSIKHAFNDISDAFVDATGIPTLLQNGPTNHFYALGFARYQINFPVYKNETAFSNPVVLQGDYLTNENNYFRIYAPSDIMNECNSISRHAGIDTAFGPVASKLQVTASGVKAIEIHCNYTVIDGMIVTATGPANVINNDGGNSTIIGNIVFGGQHGVFDSTQSANIVNNVIYSCGGDGINGDCTIYNNTVVNCVGAGIRNVTTTAINNICQNNSPDFILATNIFSISKDSSAGTKQGSHANQTVAFANASLNDYHINQSDLLIRSYGKSLIHDPSFSFDVEAQNLPRDYRWDYGALEYKPNKVFYAVGTKAEVKIGGPLFYSIDTDQFARSIITFKDGLGNEVDQIDPGMGVGNMVFNESNGSKNEILIQQKVTKSKWVVTGYRGQPLAPVTSASVGNIRRPFQSLSDLLDSVFSNQYINSSDLHGLNLQVNAVCYYDNQQDYTPASVQDLITDMDCTLKIYAPYDTDLEVNTRQRHLGLPGYGYYLSTNNFNLGGALNISNVHFVYIEGLMISESQSPGLIISNCADHTIVGNIIHDCGGEGVNCSTYAFDSDSSSGTPINSQDLIVNNIIYNCKLDGLLLGNESENDLPGNINILNNTIDNCQRGIHVVTMIPTGGSDDTNIAVNIENNICQRSDYQDYVIERPSYKPNHVVSRCISGDASANFYTWLQRNFINTTINFSNRIFGDYNLAISDYAAVSDADQLSNIQNAFLDDNALRLREDNFWDIGALEHSSTIFGGGNLIIGPIITDAGFRQQLASKGTLDIELHLRLNLADHKLNNVPISHQFTNIPDLNEYVNLNYDNYKIYNLIISFEGGQTFDGSFDLMTRGDRTVTIRTYPPELSEGPGSFKYTQPAVTDDSVQSVLIFQDLKIFSDIGSFGPNDNGPAYYLINTTASTTQIRFIDCIVELNLDAITDNPNCIIQAYGTLFLYRNSGNDGTILTNLYLIKSPRSGNVIANSIILSRNDDASLKFYTCTSTSTDEMHNVLTYNYAPNRLLNLGNTGYTFSCMPNIDPMIEDINSTTYDQRKFNILTMFGNKFLPVNQSPLVNAGDNKYVQSTTDIIGNDRIYDFGVVDIGPYELEVIQLSFSAGDIANLYQDKLVLDTVKKAYTSVDKQLVMFDLYQQFDDNPEYRTEFVRESKIIISLKDLGGDYKLISDKGDIPVKQFEAYYDASTMTIVVTKNENFLGNLFTSVFGDGRCIFIFNQATNVLSAYINDTFYKGLSGDRNPVKNVRYGGSAIATN